MRISDWSSDVCPADHGVTKNSITMKRSETVLLGSAGIFAAGAAVGTLFAPNKGERTRRYIARKGRQFFHSANDAWADGKDKLEEIRDRMTDELQGINEEVEELKQCQSRKQ